MWDIWGFDPAPASPAQPGVYVVGADGSHLRRLSDALGDLVWSPDGCWIAENEASLHLISPQTGQNILVASEGMTSGMPAWSPDSTRLAVTVDPDYTVPGDSDVAIFPIDGSGPPVSIKLPGDQFDEAWLPDGRIVILDGGGLWVVRPDGTVIRRVTTGPLTWGRILASPDAETVAVVQWPKDGVSNDDVVLVDIRREQVTPRPICGEAGILRVRKPSWSPAGDRLICPVSVDGRAGAIIAPADGSPTSLLDGSITWPLWSLGSDRIVGVDNVTGPSQDLVTLSPDGTGRRTVLSATGHPLSEPLWSATGTEIVFRVG
jgi:Tol biopolymer transport system component